MDDVVGGITGLIPVAMAGGITVGMTKQAMQIPGMVDDGYERGESRREERRRKRQEKRHMSNDLFGPPPRGIF